MRIDLRYLGLGMVFGTLPGLISDTPAIRDFSIILLLGSILVSLIGVIVEENHK